jgi:alpha-glucosidase
MRIFIITALALLVGLSTAAKNYSVSSPNNRIVATVADNNSQLTFSIVSDGNTLLTPSAIGLNKGNSTTTHVIKQSKKLNNKQNIDAFLYRQSNISLIYNEIALALTDKLTLTVRAYNQGVAYRYATTEKGETTIINETAEYQLPSDNKVYLPYSTNKENNFAMAFQNYYDATQISHAEACMAFLPVTVAYDNNTKLTILESDLEAYPGMFLRADSVKHTLTGVYAPYPRTTDYYKWRYQQYVTSTEDYICRSRGARNYPWRVFAVTTDDTQMPVNDLVYALASPSRVADTSWIKDGKVAWDWWNDWGLKGVPFKAGINMDTYKYYIDFAAENGIEYIILDEGWYDSKGGDMLTTIPEINLEELIAYGHKRGVGIVLWTVFNVLDSQLEEACAKYSAMGIKGFKVDFLDRDDQTAVEMTYRIAEATARHHLVLDLHGFYKPTGINRTYPNIINFESVFGMEEMKWSEPSVDMPLYDVTFPFIRMMAGPVDYTPGAMRNASRSDWKAVYYNPMSMGTRCHQLATYIVIDSPFTMLSDAPTNYLSEEECVDFMTSTPTKVDETQVIAGVMGQYIVTARRSGSCWWVGGLTNWDSRNIAVDFAFLPKNQDFRAVIFSDGINANKQATDYRVDTLIVNSLTKRVVPMAQGGGFAMRLEPYYQAINTKVTAIPAEKRAAIDEFYQKYVDCDGLYVVSSANVSDEALLEASKIVNLMLAKREDVRKAMVASNCHVLVIGKDENTCDIPEYQATCTDDPEKIAYWNRRARGFGGAPEDDISSGCGEENLLALPTDRYVGENILIHEFAHLIHTMGIQAVEPDFNDRLNRVMEHAKANGLWENTYALSDKEEYFAECVQSFFNCNRYAYPANGVHTYVNRRAKLKAYDPEMYSLLSQYFDEIDIPINNTIHH